MIKQVSTNFNELSPIQNMFSGHSGNELDISNNTTGKSLYDWK